MLAGKWIVAALNDIVHSHTATLTRAAVPCKAVCWKEERRTRAMAARDTFKLSGQMGEYRG